MSLAKQAVLAVALGVLATITAGVVAFLNEVHLEISFDKLKDFRATDLASYAALGTALKLSWRPHQIKNLRCIGLIVTTAGREPSIKERLSIRTFGSIVASPGN